MKTESYLNFEYTFERRRYGGGRSCRFFTWLKYRVKGETAWETFGDPWPKPRLNKVELQAALNDIACITIKPGMRVRTHLGDQDIVKGVARPHCLLALVEVGGGRKVEMPLFPGMICEVLCSRSETAETYMARNDWKR